MKVFHVEILRTDIQLYRLNRNPDHRTDPLYG